MNRSTPGLPVHHQLLEFTQTHVHWVSDAIQPSHPLSSPSPPAPNPFQDQSLFQWINSSHEVAKVLEFHLQHHSLQRNPRADLLQNGLVGSPCSPRDSQDWELTRRKPFEHKTQHHPTTNSTLCRTPHLNNKQNKNTNPIISRQDYYITQPWPSEGKQTNKKKNSAQILPYTSLHKPLDQP